MRSFAAGVLLCGLLLWALPSRAADLTVSAAASLTNAFGEIGRLYEQVNPGSKVLFNFGASGSLLQQIARGAPVDVFATADLETMDRAQKQNLIARDTRSNFAANRLVLVVPQDAKAHVAALADLSGPGVARIALGNPESVPAGRYAREVLESAGLWESLKDKYVFGQNVRQVLDYVARGEVDAAMVYSTDSRAMKGRVDVVVELATMTAILYPIAAVKGGGNEKSARRFIDLVRSEQGQAVLSRYGFKAP